MAIAKGEQNVGAAAPADPKAREFLRKADPVMARLIEDHPDFRPRAWMDDLPPMDAFGTLVFQVIGQQLSVAATRTILSRLMGNFGGRLPSPAELLAADAQALRSSGMSARKGATLRAIAERFVDGRLNNEVLGRDERRRGRGSADRGRSAALSSGRTLSTTHQPNARWNSWRSAGDRIEAWV